MLYKIKFGLLKWKGCRRFNDVIISALNMKKTELDLIMWFLTAYKQDFDFNEYPHIMGSSGHF